MTSFRLIAPLLVLGAASPLVAATQCRSVPTGIDLTISPDVHLHVRTVGRGTPVLLIPSLARGVSDFDEVAETLGKQGYLAILPDPRGTGRTAAPVPGSLADLAADDAAVVRKLCNGPVDVVGHAFGNRVARSFAANSPDLVQKVVLLAGGGKAKPLPQVGDSVALSAQEGIVSDERRLRAIKTAFFAEGHDPSVWRSGWYPQAAACQAAAMKGSTIDQWWSGGRAPILLVQAEDDPVAPAGNVQELARSIGPRLTVVTLRHASHAILPEQPAAMAWLLATYLSGGRSQTDLQAGADARIQP